MTTPHRNRTIILIVLFVLWMFGISGLYYVTQKPFDLSALPAGQTPFQFSAAALGRTLLDLGIGLWLWGAMTGAGVWVYRFVLQPASDSSRLAALVFSAGLGFGLSGLLVFGLGLSGLFTPPIFWALALILTIAALPGWRWLWQLPADFKPAPPRLARLYLSVTLLLGLSIALLPPTDWDGLFYHLTGPKIYLAHQQIVGGIDIPHLSFPGLMEMNFTLAMALRGDITAKLLHFGFVWLLGGLTVLLARDYLRVRQAWWSLLLLLSMPMVLTLAGWAYNDLALAFYEIAALYALLRWAKVSDWRANQPRWLILSGMLAGLAMGLKYTSVVAVTLLGLTLLWLHGSQRINRRRLAVNGLWWGGTALLTALPWYLKNWAFTGNPVYPFVFGGTFWDEFRAAAYAGAGTGIGFDPLALLTSPVTLTLGINDANYLDGRMGPLFLIFLPLLLIYGLGYRRDRQPLTLRILMFFALGQFGFWLIGVINSQGLWQSRLLLPAFVALTPVLVWILQDLAHLNQRHFSLHRFITLLLGVVLSLTLIDQLFNNQLYNQSGWVYYQPLHQLSGTESREAYLTRRLGSHYTAIEAVNDNLSADAVVEFLWEPRSYYCQVECRPDSILDRYTHLAYLHNQAPTSIAAHWQDTGVTHLLVYRYGLKFLSQEATVHHTLRPNPALLTAWETTDLELVADIDGVYQLYRLK